MQNVLVWDYEKAFRNLDFGFTMDEDPNLPNYLKPPFKITPKMIEGMFLLVLNFLIMMNQNMPNKLLDI